VVSTALGIAFAVCSQERFESKINDVEIITAA